MSQANTRRQADLNELMKKFKVEMTKEDDILEFLVEVHGPKDSSYEGFKWRVWVVLPEDYPIGSPIIGFSTPFFHPNVEINTGIVCVNVLHAGWSPTSTLLILFEQYLPQLLRDPNPDSPLNLEAASRMKNNSEEYEKYVREHCLSHATPEEDNGTGPVEPPSLSNEKKSKADNSSSDE